MIKNFIRSGDIKLTNSKISDKIPIDILNSQNNRLVINKIIEFENNAYTTQLVYDIYVS